VTPIEERGTITYQAASPDEVKIDLPRGVSFWKDEKKDYSPIKITLKIVRERIWTKLRRVFSEI
jgi:hypothetical protein